MKIKISNIHPSTTEDELLSLFEEFGEVLSLEINEEPDPQKFTYTAFAEMAYNEEAEDAIEELDGERIDGNVLRIRGFVEEPPAVSAENEEDAISEEESPEWVDDVEVWETAKPMEKIKRTKPRGF